MSNCAATAREGYKVWSDKLSPEVRSRVRQARYCNEGIPPRDKRLREEYEADLQAGNAPLNPKFFLVRISPLPHVMTRRLYDFT